MATATSTKSTMNADQQAQLEALILQLMNGGTQAMQQQSATRQGEVNATKALRAGYSKEAAFADAQGLMAQVLKQSMEKAMPTITRGAEGAGASGSSMRALLAANAAENAAQSSAAAGLGAAQSYGQISANLAGVLEGLTRTDNSGLQSLLQAFQLLQNANVSTTSTTGDGAVGSSGGGSSSSGGSGTSSTDAFFKSIAARANTPQNVVAYGPFVSDSQIYDVIRAGSRPTQQMADVPNIDSLFTDRYTF